MKTSNLSADNFKKIFDLDGSTLSPRYGQVILVSWSAPLFDSCQLITTLMCNICVQYQSSCAPKLARKCKIEHWLPCGAVYGHVITKFSEMGRFTYPWCFAGALRAPELSYNQLIPEYRNYTHRLVNFYSYASI